MNRNPLLTNVFHAWRRGPETIKMHQTSLMPVHLGIWCLQVIGKSAFMEAARASHTARTEGIET